MRRRSFRLQDAADLSALAIATRTETRGPQLLIRILMGALLLSLVVAALAVGAAHAASSTPNIGIPLTPTTAVVGDASTAPTTVAAVAAAGAATPPTGQAASTPTTTAATPGTPATGQSIPAATAPLNPGLRFTQGTVQFLPEYDSTDVLVMIDYQLPPDVKTPFTFQFRVPANSRMTGYALVDTNGSFDYNRPAPTVVKGDQWDVVSVSVPKSKPVHIEFYYNPGLSLTGPRDFPVIYDPPAVIDQLILEVQQPSRATAFAVSPGFAQVTQGSDGFTFREESRAAVQPGQPITAQVAYGKPDANPSLPAASGTGGATGGANSTGTSAASGGSGGSGYLLWIVLAAVAAGIGIMAYRMPRWRSAVAASHPAQTTGRARAAAPPPRPSRSGGTSRSSTRPLRTSTSTAGSALRPHDLEAEGGLQRFCTQCGETFSSTDRFCGQCGRERTKA